MILHWQSCTIGLSACHFLCFLAMGSTALYATLPTTVTVFLAVQQAFVTSRRTCNWTFAGKNRTDVSSTSTISSGQRMPGHAGLVKGAKDGVQVRDLPREAAQEIQQRDGQQRHSRLARGRPLVGPVRSHIILSAETRKACSCRCLRWEGFGLCKLTGGTFSRWNQQCGAFQGTTKLSSMPT